MNRPNQSRLENKKHDEEECLLKKGGRPRTRSLTNLVDIADSDLYSGWRCVLPLKASDAKSTCVAHMKYWGP